MPSQTVLELANKILAVDGEYSSVTDVKQTPSGVGNRILLFMNLVLAEIVQARNKKDLQRSLILTQTTDPLSMLLPTDAQSIQRVVIGTIELEEVTQGKFFTMSSLSPNANALPSIYTQTEFDTGEVVVTVYPEPLVGTDVHVLYNVQPTQFTLDNLSTTNVSNIDGAIILGVLSMLDNYSSQDRGYSARYAEALRLLYMDTHMNEAYRVEVEQY